MTETAIQDFPFFVFEVWNTRRYVPGNPFEEADHTTFRSLDAAHDEYTRRYGMLDSAGTPLYYYVSVRQKVSGE